MKKKIGWGILGTVAASIISLVVHEAPARDLEIIGVYFAVVGLITLGLYHAKDDLGFYHDFVDFITIFVSTETRRQQYQDKINWWNHYLFDARDVPLQDFNDFPSVPN